MSLLVGTVPTTSTVQWLINQRGVSRRCFTFNWDLVLATSMAHAIFLLRYSVICQTCVVSKMAGTRICNEKERKHYETRKECGNKMLIN